ncbi:MAG: DUF3160 domain-containing protein [Clostridia bacterium]|nr:DUF3160 domain-containing protein [Clostridia bacterium]
MEEDSSKPNSEKIMKTKRGLLITIMLIIVISLALIISYFFLVKQDSSQDKSTENNLLDIIDNNLIDVIDNNISENDDDSISGFADYQNVPVNIIPQIPSYKVNSDLSNITNIADYTLSNDLKELLIQNSFAVKPAYYNEFFPLYEANRYSYTPSFITTDSMLHNYHLMFDFLLKQLEEKNLVGELKKLNANLLANSLSDYQALKGSGWENAAKRNIGFFAVGSKLLDPSIKIPEIVKQEVEAELALIKAHNGIDSSPVMNLGIDPEILIDTPQGPQSPDLLKEDYSQYIPRGHYDQSDDLKAYFKSMMWYGRLGFRLKNEDETKSAIIISLNLNNETNRKSWDKLYEPINFFVGKSDDINNYQFKALIEDVYGDINSLKTLPNESEKFNKFLEKAKNLEAPKINSMPVFDASIQADRDTEIKAFRFLGQRYTIDADIFQRLIYREVGDKSSSCKNFDPVKTNCLDGARCLPAGLDIPATLGSQEANSILHQLGETKYACYQENIQQMSQYISTLNIGTWTQNLYWGWLHQLRPLLTEKQSGYPSFMLNSAWQRKDLNSFLGSWSELKHDTILYAKQVYAELGGMGPVIKDDRGYVEPNVHVYARLASLIKMTTEGLESRDLLSESMKDNLSKMESLALSLKTISEKELENKSLSEEEYELIRSYGGQLEHLWLDINKDETAFQESTSPRDYLSENPASIIADVATDPNGRVLEVGTGPISEIYVVVPIDGKLRLTKGGVYSYYEFPWPMSDRLTDTKWREILKSDEAPALPNWTKSFISN